MHIHLPKEHHTPHETGHLFAHPKSPKLESCCNSLASRKEFHSIGSSPRRNPVKQSIPQPQGCLVEVLTACPCAQQGGVGRGNGGLPPALRPPHAQGAEEQRHPLHLLPAPHPAPAAGRPAAAGLGGQCWPRLLPFDLGSGTSQTHLPQTSPLNLPPPPFSTNFLLG